MSKCCMLAQASQNELKKASGGELGDQSGAELNAVPFFDYPWGYIFRALNNEDAEKIADFMEKACSNGFIGYDQNTEKRETLFNNVKNIDFKVDELTEKSACDCSSLVYCAVYNVTKQEFTPTPGNTGMLYSPVVRMFNDYLLTTCEGYFERISLAGLTEEQKKAELQRGDIVLKTIEADETNHIAVWI